MGDLVKESAAIKNLKTQIGQLAKNIQLKKSEIDLEECKVLSLQEENDEVQRDADIGSKFCGISYLQENNFAYERIPSQLPEKEPNPGKFLLPCTIDMSRATPKVIVDNVLLRVNKFIFPGDFLIIDMIDEHNNNLILGRSFLATSHANIKVFEKEITLENGEDRITFNHNGSLKSVNTSLEEVCMINEANNTSVPKNPDIYTNPVLCDLESCENCNFNPFEESVSYSKQAQDRHDQIMSRIIDRRNPVLKNHYCNPIMMWTCFHGIERRDIEFGNLSFHDWYRVRFGNNIINEKVIKGFQQDYDYYRSNFFDECQSNLPNEVFNEKWITRNFGTANIDKKTRLKAFVEWMIDSYSDKLDAPEELKIGVKWYMLQDIWEKCERTFKKGRKFWHEVELEAMEVHGCQLEGSRHDPPEVKVETFKVRKYTMDGVGSFISIDKTIDKQLPVGRMNGAKFKELIREEMHTQLGVRREFQPKSLLVYDLLWSFVPFSFDESRADDRFRVLETIPPPMAYLITWMSDRILSRVLLEFCVMLTSMSMKGNRSSGYRMLQTGQLILSRKDNPQITVLVKDVGTESFSFSKKDLKTELFTV
ncbi:hypothetical protein CTI12_AA393950 [Artemisia annua]|uniref:Reverse transcriptase domain-containing protein n=1 Tax=Artemisia annua TaxID=35608 RepID=A0A2U1MD18_ARTAN|nr:hypothetical protein CTI12_AA393950 [Artemisia annua]